MGIRDRLTDAKILWENGRREGAFLSVLIALAATSRKRYPHPQHGDRKAFTTFLKDEMLRLTRKVNFIPTLEWTVGYQGQTFPFEDFLYEFLRCELAHEAQMPSDIEFKKFDIPVAILPQGNKLLIHHALLFALNQVVLEVPENNDEFPNPSADSFDFTI